MHILIFTNHFFPESFRVNDIAFEMAGRGHCVKVVTAIPDYPQGHFYDGYTLFRKRKSIEQGVEIVRFPIFPRGNGGAARMILNYASVIFFSFFYGLWNGVFHRADCIFIHDTSPAFICMAAHIAGRLQKAPVYHWVLDLWPESLVAGKIEGGIVFSMISGMMQRIFEKDNKILVSSKSVGKLITQRGISDSKITYFPNWSDNVNPETPSPLPVLPEGFKIMFAGNIGEAQNMENILQAALLTKNNKELHWIFVGDDRKKEWAEKFVADNSLSDTVHLLGRYPIGSMSYFWGKADVLMLSLLDTPIFNITVPAKLQAYMAASKPVWAILHGDGANLVSEAGCGWSTDPSKPEEIAATALEISRESPEKLYEASAAAKRFYDSNFDRSMCMDKFEHIVLKYE